MPDTHSAHEEGVHLPGMAPPGPLSNVTNHRVQIVTPDAIPIKLDRPLAEVFPELFRPARPELLSTPSSPVYQLMRTAVAAQSFLSQDEEDGPTLPTAHLTTSSASVKAVVQVRPDPEQWLVTAPADAADVVAALLSAMNDATADTLDAVCALWLQDVARWDATATVTADDILELRGLQRKKGGTGRRGGYYQTQREEIARQIGLLACLWITVFAMPIIEAVEGKKGVSSKPTTWQGESPALVVTSPLGGMRQADAPIPSAWRLRPGDVFAKFLFGAGRQTALLSRQTLAYDPYRQKWEKRLARYLAWQWRIRQARESYAQPFTVATLLEAIRVEIDHRNPKRTKTRLEKALATLQRDGVIAAWRYEHAPQDGVKRVGWWRDWLRCKAIIEPPEAITCHYQTIASGRTSRRTRKTRRTPKRDPGPPER